MKSRPVRKNKIDVTRLERELDVNSDLTHFFVRNIDEIQIVVEKKVN